MQSNKILSDFIEASNGKFVGVTFVKNEGTVRDLVGRLGVTSHLVNPSATPKPKTEKQKQYITIFDTQKNDYRLINRDAILSVRSGGVVVKLKEQA